MNRSHVPDAAFIDPSGDGAQRSPKSLGISDLVLKGGTPASEGTSRAGSKTEPGEGVTVSRSSRRRQLRR